jgi:hypothetical protein
VYPSLFSVTFTNNSKYEVAVKTTEKGSFTLAKKALVSVPLVTKDNKVIPDVSASGITWSATSEGPVAYDTEDGSVTFKNK